MNALWHSPGAYDLGVWRFYTHIAPLGLRFVGPAAAFSTSCVEKIKPQDIQ